MNYLALSILRPTQITVGLDYVKAKALITARHAGSGLEHFMSAHAIHIVMGPDDRSYIVDHHHWARAWHDLGHLKAPVMIVADWRRLGHVKFWRKMETKGWVHPFDAKGRRCDVSDLPMDVGGMTDDPYHSLAAFARRAGAYRKPDSAYGSFVWSDFLRTRVAIAGEDPGAFSLALLESIRLAQSRAARKLPGYIGRKNS
ncbi:ParB/Srx family N-terminal domain-containing protein [Paraburkholderia strydomiana]|uniref:ParB/Srx family N-terminal domain-containing protein n=1 Tax=Paraburkholderia strydomiana TaxID=1245417 RepID=UPI00285EDC00|nr:ParB/Srx family N-terminal domain-containing protein [Paraburkholderia strydomiana]MDR7008952.1 hypothetical protein [Paraburkholderia strydomiana]